MGTWTIRCEQHDGTFEMPSRRGRKPTVCNNENPCSGYKATTARRNKSPQEVASEIKNRNAARTADLDQVARRADSKNYHQELADAVQGKSEPRSSSAPTNPCIPLAKAARDQLEPLGWTCKGRAGTNDKGDTYAQVTAVRGEEMIILDWFNGQLTDQIYNLWNVERPQANGKVPNKRLSFDPEDLCDSELLKMLEGMTVKWWNRIAKSEETGTIPPAYYVKDEGREARTVASKLTIEHCFEGGDETPGSRIIKFMDLHGGGFRAFRIDQLLQVGK